MSRLLSWDKFQGSVDFRIFPEGCHGDVRISADEDLTRMQYLELWISETNHNIYHHYLFNSVDRDKFDWQEVV